MYIDSHCHLDKLNLEAYDGNLDAALQAARDAGVQQMLCIGIDLEHFGDVQAIAEAHEDIHCTVGVHPLYDEVREPTIDDLLERAQHPKVVAIGETGLDYHYSKDENQWQRDRFEIHLAAAKQSDLPVIVHTRAAKKDTIDMIRDSGVRRGVMHCFTEDLPMAEAAIDLGFHISISGIVTFHNAKELREVVSALPMERLLIETDCPWLAPMPHRGKPNEPKHVVHVAERIAELKGLEASEVARITTENFQEIFF